MARTGIILAQLGGPKSLTDVAPFIRSIFSDPRLVQLPGGRRTRSVVSSLVSRMRRSKVQSHYEMIGGGSPIGATTRIQGELLEDELFKRGRDVVVRVAQRHSSPSTDAAVTELLAAGAERFVLLPLYPHYSGATTGSSEDELRRVLAKRAPDLSLQVVRSWCDHPSYVAAQTRLIEETLSSVALDSSLQVVFSAHGLPQKMVDRGDFYVAEIEASVLSIMDSLHVTVDYVIAYQSRASPVRWVGPNLKDLVKAAAGEGHTRLCVVPISFVSEHVETLYELDIELKELALSSGITDFYRARCFDTDPVVGQMLADVVEPYS